MILIYLKSTRHFAVVTMAAEKELDLDSSKVNIMVERYLWDILLVVVEQEFLVTF